MNISQLLANDNYIVVNRDLIKILGLNEALLLGELAGEYSYWLKRNELDEDGYFYSTIENITQNLTFKFDKQQTLLKKLIDKGLIKCKLKGSPPKRYIKINQEALLKLFS